MKICTCRKCVVKGNMLAVRPINLQNEPVRIYLSNKCMQNAMMFRAPKKSSARCKAVSHQP